MLFKHSYPKPGLRPYDLRCEFSIDPLGIDCQRPRLSWKLPGSARCRRQTACRILVADSRECLAEDNGSVWDSGRTETDQCHLLEYEGKVLGPMTCYYWKVMAWDEEEQAGPWSSVARWEMGVLSPEGWAAGEQRAEWVVDPRAPAEEGQCAAIFQKTVELSEGLCCARAYVCGLGYYELSINGKRVGDRVLDPAQTDYEKVALYATYDITNNLRRGDNTIEILVGDGWYNQCVPDDGRFSYGRPGVIALIRMRLNSGETVSFVTDSTWRVLPSCIIRSQIYTGEVYDARCERPASETGSDDSAYPCAEVSESLSPNLRSQTMPPICRIELLRAILVSEARDGVWVFDLGQNIAGWVRLKVRAPAGTRITLTFSEELNSDGTINTDSTGVFHNKAPQQDVYICGGSGTEMWEPRFTYHGFRYVEVEGLAEPPDEETITGVVVHSDLHRQGDFDCSDPMLGRIHSNAMWTIRGNIHGVLTDCPHRERCAWTGDAHTAMEAMIYTFDSALFWGKYCHDIETSLANGLPTSISPGKRGAGDVANPDWGAAVVIIPYNLWRYYGDTRTMEHMYRHMRRYVDWLDYISEEGIIKAGQGDWFDPPLEGPDAPSDYLSNRTPAEKTSTAFYCRVVDAMAEMAGVLGREPDRNRYEKLGRSIREAFHQTFFDEQAMSYGSQTANAVALQFGLVPSELRNEVIQSLVRDISDHNYHFTTGIHGGRVLYDVLSRSGHGQTAQRIMHQKTYPSIGYLIGLGATTMWENWSRSAGYRGKPRSHNHVMNCGFAMWFQQSLGGIRLDSRVPAFKRIVFAPDVENELEYVYASYESPYGSVISHWRFDGDQMIWRIAVPANCTAEVVLPATGRIGKATESGKRIDRANGIRLLDKSDRSLLLETGSGQYVFRSLFPREARKMQRIGLK